MKTRFKELIKVCPDLSIQHLRSLLSDSVHLITCKTIVVLTLLFGTMGKANSQDWDYPSGNTPAFSPRQDIYFQWSANPRDMYYYFYWTEYSYPADAWYYEHRPNYYQELFTKSNCIDGGTANRLLSHASPCYTLSNNSARTSGGVGNYARVIYERYNGSCTSKDKLNGPEKGFTIKVPTFPPPLPRLGQYYSCADGSVSITVDVKSDIFHNEWPNRVTWYLLNTSDPLHIQRTIIKSDDQVATSHSSTLNYDLGNNLAAVIEVVPSRQYAPDCTVEGLPIQIPVTSAINVPLMPPKPILVTNCRHENNTVTVPNEYDYDGVFWYENLIGQSIASGFTFEIPAGRGLQQYYIEYYVDLGDGCYAKSAKSPVYVYTTQKINSPITEIRGIYDWRHMDEEDCFVTRDDATGQAYPYYTDLPDLSVIQPVIDQLKLAIESTETNCFQISDLKIATYWDVTYSTHTTTEDWYDYQNGVTSVKRICAENITNNEAEIGLKLYELKATASFNLRYCGASSQLVDGGLISCGIDGSLQKVMVKTKSPGALTDLGCNFPPEALVQSIIEKQNPICDRRNDYTICPKTKIKTGPTQEELAEYFFGLGFKPSGWETMFTYSWTPSDGLSSTTTRNPEVGYDGVPVPNYNLMLYKCKITYGGSLPISQANTLNFCAFIYKCGTCGTIIDTPTSDY